MKALRVRPLELGGLHSEYHIGVVAAGFESRSRHIAERQLFDAQFKYAVCFPDRQVVAYDDNIATLSSLGYHIEEIEDSKLFGWMVSVIDRVSEKADGDVINVALDVSSMSRFRIAAVLDACRKSKCDSVVEVDILYSLAAFTSPPTQSVPNAHVGPVLPSLAGWSIEPELAPNVILGLGYEQDRALGAVEHLQPGAVWAFVPRSSVEEYAPHVRTANAILFESLPKERLIPYDVERPFDCFSTLESLVYGIMDEAFPVLLPLGPKIFGALCILVGFIHSPGVAVWRVSPGVAESPVNREPSGVVACIKAMFIPT